MYYKVPSDIFDAHLNCCHFSNRSGRESTLAETSETKKKKKFFVENVLIHARKRWNSLDKIRIDFFLIILFY